MSSSTPNTSRVVKRDPATRMASASARLDGCSVGADQVNLDTSIPPISTISVSTLELNLELASLPGFPPSEVSSVASSAGVITIEQPPATGAGATARSMVLEIADEPDENSNDFASISIRSMKQEVIPVATADAEATAASNRLEIAQALAAAPVATPPVRSELLAPPPVLDDDDSMEELDGLINHSDRRINFHITEEEDEFEWYRNETLAQNAFPAFEEIRSTGKLCDVTLLCGNARFSAHRVVLAATIPYFRAMFTHDMVESGQREIRMQETIEPDILEQLIGYAYTGRVKLSSHNVQALHIGAAFLQLKSICEACSSYLMERLYAHNVLGIRQYAEVVGADELIRSCDQYMNKHFMAVKLTDDFMKLSFHQVSDIIGRDQLYVPSEEPVFEAMMSWIRYDISIRSLQIADLLALIRLPLLKPQFITDRVASDELIKNCLTCRDLVDEAKDYHLMPERRALLSSFRTKPRCCDDLPGIIYAVGGLTNTGDSLSTVEIFDPVVAKWSNIDPMTTLRSRVGVSVMGRKLYAIGGFNGHERLRTVEVYDPDTKKWQEISSLNNKRSALGAAVVGDRLFVCGGYDGVSSLNSVECYDSYSDRWYLAPAMNKQRSAAGIAVLDGQIYVMGGHDGMSIFNSVECYDLQKQQWRIIKPMNSRRCRLGATAINGKIFACGGYDGSQFLRTVECYDPRKNEWSQINNMNVKRSRVALVANCGKLFAIGGYDGISNLSSMEVFDVKEETWTFGASMIAHEGGVGIGVIPIVPFIESQ